MQKIHKAVDNSVDNSKQITKKIFEKDNFFFKTDNQKNLEIDDFNSKIKQNNIKIYK